MTVNTPPAELMMSFLGRAKASTLANHAMLAALIPALVAKRHELEALIGTHEQDVSYHRRFLFVSRSGRTTAEAAPAPAPTHGQ